jgi:Ion channel
MRGRYGVVLAATVAALITTVALPAGRHTDDAVIAIQGALLVVVLLAVPPAAGGRLAQIAGGLAAICGVAAALGGMPGWLVFGTSTLFLCAAIVGLSRGALDQLDRDGVTEHVVAAALAIYLLAGLLFATAIGVVAVATEASYFAQGTDGTQADRVYFSFACLTTTGFGDLTPALGIGRALAVTEMLTGQIYLVTIVAMLIGNLRGRRPAR